MGNRTKDVLEDTIIAIATPPGIGGLGIVRLSGPEAANVARRIFEPKAGKMRPFPVRRPVFGAVNDPETGLPLDEAFLTYFQGPRSYTGEDVVEISTHGSPAVLEAVLRTGTGAGARLARPGEFTLRAHLNGRLDILQAQAVDVLVRSVTLAQARVSSRQLGGSLSRRVRTLRERLVSLVAKIEAGIEFPEEGLRTSRAADRKSLDRLIDDVGRLIASYEAGKALAEGVTLALVGRTNVGKSTLFNALLEEERAIVTPFPGTTRDYLRERLLIDGVVFHLVDMAGLGRPSHPVESRGIARGRRLARGADGLIIVLDASRRETPEDERLLRRYPGKKAIVVLNKSDLPRKISERRVRERTGEAAVVEISALKGRGVPKLRALIREVFVPPAAREEEIVLHARQRDGLREILEALRRARGLLEQGRSEELCAEEMRTAVRHIGELTGEVRADEVLADIFARFCVGK